MEAQQLGALSVLPQHPDLISISQKGTQSSVTPILGDAIAFSWLPQAAGVYRVHRYTSRKNTHTHEQRNMYLRRVNQTGCSV